MKVNESRPDSCAGRVLPYVFFFIYAVTWVALAFPVYPCGDWSGYYSPGEPYIEWFSPLFHLKMEVLNLMLPGAYSASACANICVASWTALILASVFIVLRSLMVSGKGGMRFMIVVIIFAGPHTLALALSRFDTAFAAWLLISVSLAFCLMLRHKNGILPYVLVLFCLFNACSYRNNAIVVLPVVLYYASGLLCGERPWGFVKRSLSTVLSTFLIAGALYLTNSVFLQAEKANGAIVMMQSDIYAISLLSKDKGDYEAVCAEHMLDPDSTRYDEVVKDFYGNVCDYGDIYAHGGLLTRYDKDKFEGSYWRAIWNQYAGADSYSDWERLWLKTLTNHFGDFLVARSVMLCHFYAYGYVPDFLSEWISKNYPGVKALSLPQKEISQYVAHGRIIMRAGGPSETAMWCSQVAFPWVYRGLLLSFYAAFAAILLFIPQWQKVGEWGRFIIACMVAAGVYALSFIPFVPSHDCRYTTPSLLLFFVAVAVTSQLCHLPLKVGRPVS